MWKGKCQSMGNMDVLYIHIYIYIYIYIYLILSKQNVLYTHICVHVVVIPNLFWKTNAPAFIY